MRNSASFWLLNSRQECFLYARKTIFVVVLCVFQRSIYDIRDTVHVEMFNAQRSFFMGIKVYRCIVKENQSHLFSWFCICALDERQKQAIENIFRLHSPDVNRISRQCLGFFYSIFFTIGWPDFIFLRKNKDFGVSDFLGVFISVQPTIGRNYLDTLFFSPTVRWMSEWDLSSVNAICINVWICKKIVF